MKRFLQKLYEEAKTESPVVMAFGRMNPPTIGHEKLVNRVKDIAKDYNAPHHVILSHSSDAKKNPLDAAAKLKHAKRFFPDSNIEVANKQMPTFLHHAQRLNAMGHDHLVMVAGSDRLDEYERLLHQYNGESHTNPKALFHFKKIEVKSAGHRDPDAEGAEGMSASKMREHAKNNNFNEFKKGVPAHVQDRHSKELFDHVRQGMGLHDLTLNKESVNQKFKVFFICGGPGSGKDILVRECFGENVVEMTCTFALNFLNDKHNLSESSSDLRKESIRNRNAILINSNIQEEQSIYVVKEELEELGYESMMIFVNTTNESSKDRNSKLERMLSESVRYERWQNTQKCLDKLNEKFDNLYEYDNSLDLTHADYISKIKKEEEISSIYEMVNLFLNKPIKSGIAESWLIRNTDYRKDSLFENYLNKKLKENSNGIYQKNSSTLSEKTCSGCGGKTTRTGWLSESIRRKSGEKVRVFDNLCPSCQIGAKARKVDDVRDGDIATNTKYTFRTYHEAEEKKVLPTKTEKPEPSETRFQQDADKQKAKKHKTQQIGQPGKYMSVDGISSTYDTRGSGTVYPMSGLGQVTYREQRENKYSKSFRKFREAIDSPSVEMGVTGGYHGPSNKEPMETQADVILNKTSNKKKDKK
jgi:predicted kinase